MEAAHARQIEEDQQGHRPQDHPQHPGQLHPHVDAHQGEDGGQAGLVAHEFGLHHPAEQGDYPPYAHQPRGVGEVPGKQGHEGPGHHDGARPDDRNEVHHRQPQGQQQAVGLPHQEEAGQQDEEDPHRQEEFRL